MKIYNIPVFVPHLGCPHDCVFCNQKRITGETTLTTPDMAKKIIEKWIGILPEESYKEIAFFGGSFTAIPIDDQNGLLKVADEYVQSGLVDGIRLSTRPDCISKEIMENLVKYGVTSIELGVQSMNDDVLSKSWRGHTRADTINAVKLIKNYPVKLGLQMMTGLPGDTVLRSIETAKEIAKLKPDFARIYPTLVIRDTALEDMLNCGKYHPFSLDETVDLLSNIKEIFDFAKIDVIRMGLQTTEEICPGASVVGGPFHPAIGELVVGKMYLKKLEEMLFAKSNCSVFIECSDSDVSKIIGHNSCNRKYLKEKYNILIKTLVKKNINEGEFKILEVKKVCF